MGSSEFEERNHGINMNKYINGALIALTTLIAIAPVNATVLKGGVSSNNFQQNGMLQGSVENSVSAAEQAREVEGTWNCVSKVVDSNCPSIIPGTVVQSFIQFLRNAEGSLVQNWQESGWTPASTPVLKFGNSQISTSKEATFQNGQGGWTARTQERMKMLNPQTMIAESTVQQYLNGQFVGTYKTTSVLRKSI